MKINRLGLTGLQRGIEKENLRVDSAGHIATTPHPKALGAALTNDWITTDFSEALVEVVTPPESELTKTYDQLKQVSQFVAQHIDGEYIWPYSMPPVVTKEETIPLAYYGKNNPGQLKTLYRKGLCHRYGRVMQVMAGIHYNVSLPSNFFETDDQQVINQRYMGLVRNFFRCAWIIPYLFGASPVCAETSVTRAVNYVERLREQTMISRYGTSLRLSDLGYHNHGESLLNISYADVASYANNLDRATKTPYEPYTKIGLMRGDERLQLNDSVLQIANEYYSPIRPKQIAMSCEKPTEALLKRGIRYVEMRLLDLNPLQPFGICLNQLHFLDTLLVYCGLKESSDLSQIELTECKENIKRVASGGRDPKLLLRQQAKDMGFISQAKQLMENLLPVAEALGQANNDEMYVQSCQYQWDKLNDVSLTPSAKIVAALEAGSDTFQDFFLSKAKTNTEELQQEKPALTPMFEQLGKKSLEAFAEIEAKPQKPFNEFLKSYCD